MSAFKIPAHDPGQHHVEPPWLSDSKKAPQAAGKKAKRGGSPYTDTNGHPLLDGCGIIHDNTPREGRWLYLAVGKGKPRRQLKPHELDLPYSKWTRANFVRLRRTRRVGLSFESRVRPLLYAESLAFHKKYGAIPVLEAKAAFPRRTVQSMAVVAKKQAMPFFVKRLVHQSRKPVSAHTSMAVSGEVLRAFHGLADGTVLSTHGYSPPPDLDSWRQFIDAYWGAKSEEYRP